MGILALYEKMKYHFQYMPIEKLKGKRIGIDGMNWLYRIFHSTMVGEE